MSKPLPNTSAPARRALSGAGVLTLSDLQTFTELEILALHGMGPKAMGILRAAMRENGLKFKEQKDG